MLKRLSGSRPARTLRDQGVDQALKWAAHALNERGRDIRGLKAEMAEKDDAIGWLRAEVDKIKQELKSGEAG